MTTPGEERTEASGEGGEQTGRPSAVGETTCNILIVDDEPSNLLALEAILEPLENVNVVRAASGIEALKHALKMELSLVLLDVQMPEMDGLECAALLRKRPRTRDVPIIFLTAISKEPSYVARGYDVGAVDYLFKPYDPDVLRTKVATFVELARKNAVMRAQHEALRIGSKRELDELKKWSVRQYEDLANSVPQVVWTADALGDLTYSNQRWIEMAGHGAAASFAGIAHPADLGSFVAGWDAAILAGDEWEAELRVGNATRGYRWHVVRAVPRRNDKGVIALWIGTATDIDPRVRAERTLRMLADASRRLNRSLEEPRELAAVLDCALPILGDGAILDLLASEGFEHERIHAVSNGLERTTLQDPRFDLGPATVVYSHRADVFLDVKTEAERNRARPDSERNPRGGEHLRFLAELGVSSYICVPLDTRDRTLGTLTFVRLSGDCFVESDVEIAGDLARRIATSVDNARLHATTEKRREELEQANRSKDVFLATLSHELRTPLNAIVGWTDMMKKGKVVGEELTRAMDTIDRNAHALSGLVADLLDVSRIVTGSLKIENKLLSLASIVEAAVLAARPQCVPKEIKIAVSLDERGAVSGDAGRLRQVITNLLVNAIKFTPHGATIDVRLETIPDGGKGRARVTVQDPGEGITPDFLPHVFERFRQEETGRAKGLGLGLAIVKHLIEEHGGSVSAASEGHGKGATFTFEVPLATASLEMLEDEAQVHSLVPSGEPRLDGVHVLIVEDDPDGNELICAILERYGARVSSTSTATDALAALESEPPDVLVSDIGLPDMDGMELIRRARASTRIGPIPAVALTAYASRQDATKAITAGFDAHVAKPVQPMTLGNAIVRLLKRARPEESTERATVANPSGTGVTNQEEPKALSRRMR